MAARQMKPGWTYLQTVSQVTGTTLTCDSDVGSDFEGDVSQFSSSLLQTNSKAFTAKTSCVRRRYSEFVWLKKKLQKNAGLV